MREVLFRGKRVVNGKWVEGFMYSQHFPLEFRDDFYIRCYDTDYLVIPETVGQYTGLTDKNGKRIFEGDIVRYGTNTDRADNKEIYEVVFETRGGSGYFGIRISEIETWQFCFEVPAKLMEVIGNIHDNPEILKGGEDNG